LDFKHLTSLGAGGRKEKKVIFIERNKLCVCVCVKHLFPLGKTNKQANKQTNKTPQVSWKHENAINMFYQEARGQNSMARVLQKSNVPFTYPWGQKVATAALLTSPKITIWEGE